MDSRLRGKDEGLGPRLREKDGRLYVVPAQAGTHLRPLHSGIMHAQQPFPRCPMTRVNTSPTRDDLPNDRRKDYDVVFDGRGRVRGPFPVLLHSPGLASGVQAAVAATEEDVLVTPAHHELVVLATAYFYDAPYQWTAHIDHAREAGLSDAAIEVARVGGDTSALDPDDRDIIEYTRQLSTGHHVEQALFDLLRDRPGERWLVELTSTIGLYQYVATYNNAFEIDPLPGPDQLRV